MTQHKDGGGRNDDMESDKALAIGKVLTLALSPARRLLGQVIAKASVMPAGEVKEVGMKNIALPVDGRGKSPGSRKTQFKRGHARTDCLTS